MTEAAPLGRMIKQGAVTTALCFAIRFGARALFPADWSLSEFEPESA